MCEDVLVVVGSIVFAFVALTIVGSLLWLLGLLTMY